MKIRAYAKAVGFEVVGKLRLMGKWNICPAGMQTTQEMLI